MNNHNFAFHFTGAALILSGLMVAAGYLLRPVAVFQNFQLVNLEEIARALDIWINSYRVLVFGLFVGLGGL